MPKSMVIDAEVMLYQTAGSHKWGCFVPFPPTNIARMSLLVIPFVIAEQVKTSDDKRTNGNKNFFI